MLDLAGFRDTVRRRLDITPKIDVTNTPTDTGQPYASQPYPSNQQINDAINSAINSLNSTIRVGRPDVSTVLQVSPCAPNWRGPQFVPITAADMADAVNVTFSDMTGKVARLVKATYYQKVKGAEPFRQYEAQYPQMWFQTGGDIGIVPGASIPGSLTVTVAQSLPQLVNDTDTLDALPASLQEYIAVQAAIVCSSMRARDVDMQARVQVLMPIAQSLLAAIVTWRNGAYQTSDDHTTEMQ